MIKKPRILVVGSLVMDLIVSTARVPNEGETVIDGLSFKTASGGKGANQAVQAARLGADVTMVGKVGNDLFGNDMIKCVKDSGVNTEYILVDSTVSSGVGSITLEVKEGQKAKNRIIVVPGANMALTVKDVEFVKNIVSEYDMVILQLEIPMRVNEAVAAYAFDKGVPVMLNSAPSAPLADELLLKLAYISPNEHEAYDLTGVQITRDGNGVDLDAVKKASAILLDKGVENVIITLGSSGVAFMNKTKFIYRPCIDVVEVVDPTAAGDSFVGAFVTAKCMGMPDEEAIDFANYTATITVSRMGAQPSLPYYTEVMNLMQSVKESGGTDHD